MKNPDDTHTPDLFGVSPGANDNAALVAQPAESGRGVSTLIVPTSDVYLSMSPDARRLHSDKWELVEGCNGTVKRQRFYERRVLAAAARLIGAGL
ncbi:hypothetical protein [Rhodoferax koreensis]|uniref:hypothetical protein n=1 Tax=Rhodoferax koreensis TaxID=1842727 RepID=UPI0012FFBA8F|nr:hypothetical protein [Rhodoferax koreense]